MNHGIFSFGAMVEESSGCMIALVDRAGKYLKERYAWDLAIAETHYSEESVRLDIAALRCDAALAAVMSTYSDPHSLIFAGAGNVRDVSQQGPATPDHLLRTNRLPLQL